MPLGGANELFYRLGWTAQNCLDQASDVTVADRTSAPMGAVVARTAEEQLVPAGSANLRS
jgi:hypothetical protein